MKTLRRFLAAALAASLVALPHDGWAATSGQEAAIINTVVGSSAIGSGVDYNFSLNGGTCTVFRVRKTCTQILPDVRASVAYEEWADGHYSLVGNNVLRITDLGLQTEVTAQNLGLWSNDLTNAVWSKTNTSAALNVTGPDNVANSASTLTASAGNGTALQSITLSSASRTYSIVVKRVTGSGTVNISQDGSTWTALTSSNCFNIGTLAASGLSTSFWVRCALTATQLNPTVGFQIVTNGDAIAVWDNQLEAGAGFSSPIITTNATATRSSDAVAQALGNWFNPTLGTIFVKVLPTKIPPIFGVIYAVFYDGSTSNSLLQVYQNSGAAQPNALVKATTNQFIGGLSTTLTAGVAFKQALSYQAANFAMGLNGVAPATQASGSIPTGLTTLTFASSLGYTQNQFVQRFIYYPSIIPVRALTVVP